MNDKIYYLIIAAVVIIGIGIRVWQFGSVPGGFNQDGAMAAVDGKAIADYGTDRFGTWLPAHLYAWGYGQMSSLLSYLIAIFVKFFWTDSYNSPFASAHYEYCRRRVLFIFYS